jgi:immunity protein 52 of polymorphic toxin system
MVPYIDITARWQPRMESTDITAGRLAPWLSRMAALDARFSRWHRSGMRHRSAVPLVVSMPPIVEELRVWLEENPSFESRNRRKHLAGYSITARRPNETSPHANFWVTLSDASRNDRFDNRIGVTFFTDRDRDDVVHLTAVVRQALLVTASLWNCEWAAAVGGNYEDMSLPQKTILKYESGWMVYVGAALAPRLHEARDITIESVGNGGALLVAVTNAIFDRRNALHIAAARRLQTALAPLNAELGNKD